MDILQPNYFEGDKRLWVDMTSMVSTSGPRFKTKMVGVAFLFTILGAFGSILGLFFVSDLSGNFYVENGIWFIIGVGSLLIILTLYMLFTNGYYIGIEKLIHFLPNDPMDIDPQGGETVKLYDNMAKTTRRSINLQNKWVV